MLVFITNTYSQGINKASEFGVGDGTLNGKEIGGAYYKRNFPTYQNFNYDYFVSTVPELVKALKAARSGQTIYLNESGRFNMTNQPSLIINSGVSLISGRRGKKGARLYITNYREVPIITINGREIQISGLLIEGPDMNVHFDRDKKIDSRREKMLKERARRNGENYGVLFKMYKEPRTTGILASGDVSFSLIDSELRGWTHSAIMIKKGAYGLIHFNFIHSNVHYGLGYGVTVDGGEALVQANFFNNNRHSIASTGIEGSVYEASYNKVGPDGIVGHAFDVHGGVDRKDGTNTAGTRVMIHNNEFICNGLAIKIRGAPLKKSEIYNNVFIADKPVSNGVFFEQTNSKKNILLYNNKYIYNNKSLIK